MDGSADAHGGMLIDEARASARNYVKALPRRDRVMIVRADALATPATAFELDRRHSIAAISESQPGSSALNLEQAFEFAQRAQKLQSQRAGEIVFAGAGRVAEDETALAAPSNFRVLAVNATQENVGLRKVGLRRSLTTPDSWDIYVAVKNYGTRPRQMSTLAAIRRSAGRIEIDGAEAGRGGAGHVHVSNERRRVSGSAHHAARCVSAG